VSEIYGSSAEAAKLRISVHQVDVGVVDEISNLFKEIQEQRKTHIDILVSNAGYGKRIVDVWLVGPRDFEDVTDEQGIFHWRNFNTH
jgi:3-oxoacyl-[acyl-carrier protein] reductase